MKKVFLAIMAVAAFSTVACTEEVNEPPQAVLDGPSVVRVNAPVVFDASKSTDKDGTIDLASITFDFGDGSEKLTGVSSASHVFTKKGDYKVAVELADDKGAAGQAARSISVTDNVTPLAKLTGPATARLGATVAFDAGGSTDSDGVIKEYSFDFGDQSPAVAGVSNASHAWAAAGTYTVTVTVTDNDSATATAAVQVTVTDNLAPVAVVKGPAAARIKQVVAFDGSGSIDGDGAIAGWSFDFGDGSAAVAGVQTAEHSYAAAGAFTVKLEVTDNDGAKGSASVQIVITANALPVAAFSGPATAVVGDVVTFDAGGSTDPDGVIAAYSFDFGDATAAGTAVQTNHVYAAAGDYNVALKATDNDGGENTATRQIKVTTVAASAEPPVAIFSGPAHAAVNAPVAFDGGASAPGSGRITAHDWDFGDTATGAGATAVHTWAAAGVYNVRLTVTATQKDGTTALTNAMTRQISVEDSTVSVASITPASGPVSGGTQVLIKGQGFVADGSAAVTFAGMAALAVDVIDGSNLAAVTPAGLPGAVDVAVAFSTGSIIVPDAFTYLGGDNRANTTFCAVVMTAVGTDVGFVDNDDDANLPIELPFDFEFFGTVYPAKAKLRVATNGWLSFDNTGASFTPAAIPSGANPSTLIAPFFMDLSMGTGGRVVHTTTGAAPNRQLAVAWQGVTSRGNASDKYTFEAVLYESSNDIKFQYLNTYGGNAANGNAATAGIQGSAVSGFQASRNTAQPGIAPGGRTYVWNYANGGYSAATDTLLTLVSTQPSAGGSLTSNGSFRVVFSAPVNPATITSSTITLVDTTTAATVPVTLTVSNDKLTVTGQPNSALTINDKYRVTVTTDVYGANKMRFSFDPNQVACGGVGSPTVYTYDFTAIAGGVNRFNLGGGSQPLGIALAPSGNIAYVAKGNGNRLVSWNYQNNVATNNLTLQDCQTPTEVAVTPSGAKVFVGCNSNPGRVAAVDPAGGGLVQIDTNGGAPGTQSIATGANPSGLAVRAAGDMLYVANSQSDTIQVFNVATYAPVITIPVGNQPSGLAIIGNKLYAVMNQDNAVQVIDILSGSGTENTVTNTINFNNSCQSPAFAAPRPDGSSLYVTCNGNNRLAVVNTAVNTLTTTIGTGSEPIGVAVSSTGSIAYVAEWNQNSVGVVDLVANTYLGSVNTGGGGTRPYGVVFVPGSTTGLVTLNNSNEIGVIF